MQGKKLVLEDIVIQSFVTGPNPNKYPTRVVGQPTEEAQTHNCAATVSETCIPVPGGCDSLVYPYDTVGCTCVQTECGNNTCGSCIECDTKETCQDSCQTCIGPTCLGNTCAQTCNNNTCPARNCVEDNQTLSPTAACILSCYSCQDTCHILCREVGSRDCPIDNDTLEPACLFTWGSTCLGDTCNIRQCPFDETAGPDCPIDQSSICPPLTITGGFRHS